MEGGNPFPIGPRETAALSGILPGEQLEEGLYETLLMATQWEIASGTPPERLPPALQKFRSWLMASTWELKLPPGLGLNQCTVSAEDWQCWALAAGIPPLKLQPASPPPLTLVGRQFRSQPPSVPSDIRVQVSSLWNAPFCAFRSNGEQYLFCGSLEEQDLYSAARIAHELAHLEHLKQAWKNGRSLATVTLWERERAAMLGEIAFIVELSNTHKWNSRAIYQEWFRRQQAASSQAPRDPLSALYFAAAREALQEHDISLNLKGS